MSEAATTIPSAQDPTPVIPVPGQGQLGPWLFGGLAVLLGIVVFSVLSAGRDNASAPSVLAVPYDPNARISSPAPLVLPPSLTSGATTREPQPTVEVIQPPPQPSLQPIPQSVPRAPTPYVPQYTPPPAPAEPIGPEIVFETRNELPPLRAGDASEASTSERVSAGRFTNPGFTVPQGTVIPAVLETALDSTRPGGVRALVQRDIYGFDGSRVLIHRGSRLYGEYDTGLQRGEKRALIQWTRLIRPDGVTIALDSPASDPLGRAGVKGKVDGKFLQRFGGAILQSVLDIGVGVATREATDGVIVALPGSTQNVTQVANPNDIRPTLKVKHGTSVSVFVARDLDFASVER